MTYVFETLFFSTHKLFCMALFISLYFKFLLIIYLVWHYIMALSKAPFFLPFHIAIIVWEEWRMGQPSISKVTKCRLAIVIINSHSDFSGGDLVYTCCPRVIIKCLHSHLKNDLVWMINSMIILGRASCIWLSLPTLPHVVH